MANTTVRGALQIHGGNPQFLVEKIIRSRIYEAQYWKEHCFALTAETIIDKAIELNCIGGVYGNQRPTNYMCLLLKLLQIQPEKEILIEYLLVDEFKYLRALAALYIRLTFRPVEVYELLEPLLKDYRKIRLRNMAGWQLMHIDEFIDQLLTEERVCDIILPRLTRRDVLEEIEGLPPRRSALLDAMDGVVQRRSRSRSRSHSRSSSRSRSQGRSESRGRSRSRSRSLPLLGEDDAKRYVSRTPSPGGSSYRSRSRSISPDRIEMDIEKIPGDV